jgi:hypothetical protein
MQSLSQTKKFTGKPDFSWELSQHSLTLMHPTITRDTIFGKFEDAF